MELTGGIVSIKWQSKYLLRQKKSDTIIQCRLGLKHHRDKIIIFFN